MKQYIFLFSGQGSQYKGMGEDLCNAYPAAEAAVKEMSNTTGEDIVSFMRQTEKEELARSDRSQLAITAMQAAILAVLKEHGILPAAAAGFSLGEFSALYAAGVLSLKTMTEVVHIRGKIMQKWCDKINEDSADGQSCGMAAVLKLEPAQVCELLKPYSDPVSGCVFAANLNSPMQTVIAGTAEGLALAEKCCMEAGARRFIRLAVAGPFHSPLMRNAAEEFAAAIDPILFADPVIPLFSNVTGKLMRSGTEAKQNAVLHLTSPVQWLSVEHELGAYTADGTHQLLEIGPGTVLTNLWKDSGCAGVCSPAGTAEQLSEIIGENR